ncbi:hypothetical protein F5Y17DRAFT_461376 [Xylariaceae sp. FL0594]|nr:hypothetical protein F5Y17DRAFT_461376 [Xylariaceae sp. FL0594]
MELFRVHIVETVDVFAVLLLGSSTACSRTTSAPPSRSRSFVLTSFSYIFAALAHGGLETPDSFVATDAYKDLEIMQWYFPAG